MCDFFVATTCIVLVALLVIILYFWKQKSKLGMKPVFMGVAIFFVFAFIFENIAHTFLITIIGEKMQKISESLLLYLLYGCSLAGIFEEMGRYVAFKHILPRNAGPKIAIGYGIGHGGIELLVGGIVFLLISQPETFAVTESLLWIGERVVALCGHIALSIIVFTAVQKNRKSLFFLAILLHGIADIPIGLYKFGTISVLACFIIFTGLVLICCLVAIICWNFYFRIGEQNETIFNIRME